MNDNFSQLTARAGQTIAETIKAVRRMPIDRRGTPNPATSVTALCPLYGQVATYDQTAIDIPAGGSPHTVGSEPLPSCVMGLWVKPCFPDGTLKTDASGSPVPQIYVHAQWPPESPVSFLMFGPDDLVAYVGDGSIESKMNPTTGLTLSQPRCFVWSKPQVPQFMLVQLTWDGGGSAGTGTLSSPGTAATLTYKGTLQISSGFPAAGTLSLDVGPGLGPLRPRQKALVASTALWGFGCFCEDPVSGEWKFFLIDAFETYTQ